MPGGGVMALAGCQNLSCVFAPLATCRPVFADMANKLIVKCADAFHAGLNFCGAKDLEDTVGKKADQAAHGRCRIPEMVQVRLHGQDFRNFPACPTAIGVRDQRHRDSACLGGEGKVVRQTRISPAVEQDEAGF